MFALIFNWPEVMYSKGSLKCPQGLGCKSSWGNKWTHLNNIFGGCCRYLDYFLLVSLSGTAHLTVGFLHNLIPPELFKATLLPDQLLRLDQHSTFCLMTTFNFVINNLNSQSCPYRLICSHSSSVVAAS